VLFVIFRSVCCDGTAPLPISQPVPFSGSTSVEGGDLYGDSVNIAARLEGIVEPGGVLVSGTIFDYVRNKVSAGFEDLGTQTLRNIAEPVRVYRVTGTPRVPIATPKAAVDKPSIAVLPFANMSTDPERSTLPMEWLRKLLPHSHGFPGCW
jgi:hypothetical protein